MAKPFNGVIKLDVRDSTPDWAPLPPEERPEGAPNVLIVLYDDTGLAAWSPFGGRINMPTLQTAGRQRPDVHRSGTRPRCARRPARRFLTGRNHHQNGCASITEGVDRLPRRAARTSRRSARTIGEVLRDERLEHVLARQEPQRAGRRPGRRARPKKNWPLQPGLRPLLRLHRRRDQQVVSRPRRGQPLHRPALHARRGLPPLEGPGRPGDRDASATSSSRSPTSPGSCGSARAPTTRRTTRRRSTSTSTRASSTTATRPTASGCCRG